MRFEQMYYSVPRPALPKDLKVDARKNKNAQVFVVVLRLEFLS
jgi:hypothetical protein